MPSATAGLSDNTRFADCPFPEGVSRWRLLPCRCPKVGRLGHEQMELELPDRFAERHARSERNLAVAVPASPNGNQPIGREQRNMLAGWLPVICDDCH